MWHPMRGQAVDGIINLDKPVGVTSAKALYRVRRITGQRKSGHAGTLDPAAEGVLLLCMGRGTKLVESLMDQPKVYRAIGRLDLTSESYDSESETTAVDVTDVPSTERVQEVVASFEGEQGQVPPAVSALKVQGRPAYKLARLGRPPQLDPRRVVIYWTHVHWYRWPELDFEVACGRGTYVRALIRDIGQRLGTGGCLTALARLAVGPFTRQEAHTFAQLEDADDPSACLVELDRARDCLAGSPVVIPPRPGNAE